MKRYLLPMSFLLIVVIPNILFGLLHKNERINDSKVELSLPEHTQMLLIDHNGEILQMELDDYVLCVLLGEVPSSFKFEALKAQAVATRTYTIRHYMDYAKHQNAHLCTNATCCQAYVPVQTYIDTGHSNEELQRIKDAVDITSNQVLTYDDELIEATYFSCSGEKTESAVDAWGRNVPYLISVESPGEENARTYRAKTTITLEDFMQKLGLIGDPNMLESSISVSYTTGGGIKAMTVFDQTFSGAELRTLLDLPSTVMDFKFKNDSLEITTLGCGHRVGMSQYGAEAMALLGNDYERILSHYYRGTKLKTLCDDELYAIFDKAENL